MPHRGFVADPGHFWVTGLLAWGFGGLIALSVVGLLALEVEDFVGGFFNSALVLVLPTILLPSEEMTLVTSEGVGLPLPVSAMIDNVNKQNGRHTILGSI